MSELDELSEDARELHACMRRLTNSTAHVPLTTSEIAEALGWAKDRVHLAAIELRGKGLVGGASAVPQ